MMAADADQRVSVIIPAYNAAKFIRATIASVLAQTHADLEVIVVDDGSVDETASLVEAIAQDDSRVRLHRQANAGVSAARNAALALASGAYIAPIDADDLWHPTKLEKQLAIFAASPPSVGFVYCWFAVIDENDDVIFPRRIYYTPTGHVYPQLVVGNIVGNASSPLLRRSVASEVGGYDTGFREGCEDLDFYLAAAERCEFGLAPEFLVGYRRSRDSMSMNIPKMTRAVDQLTRKIDRQHPDLPQQLFRWRDGNMYRYLALHSLMDRKYLMAASLAAKAVAVDPLLFANWCLRKFSLLARRAQAENPPQPSRRYLDVDPRPEPFEQYEASPMELRRNALAAAVRLSSAPPGPSNRDSSEEEKTTPKLSVVVPTLNRGRFFFNTIRQILDQRLKDIELVIVDQSDAEQRRANEAFIEGLGDRRIRYMHLTHKNLPNARNEALGYVSAPIVLFLDDDVLLIEEDFLDAHLAAFDDPLIGGVTGRTIERSLRSNSQDTAMHITPGGRTIINLAGTERRAIPGLKGANMSFRREAIESVGGFDRNYVGSAILEDIDFSVRLAAAGWRMIFEPKAELVHLSASSGGVRIQDAMNREYWRFRLTSYFIIKNRGALALAPFLLTFSLIAASRALRWRSLSAIPRLAGAVRDGLATYRQGVDQALPHEIGAFSSRGKNEKRSAIASARAASLRDGRRAAKKARQSSCFSGALSGD
jgi:glycosyltransferase involved in cell wall biosynthesis